MGSEPFPLLCLRPSLVLSSLLELSALSLPLSLPLPLPLSVSPSEEATEAALGAVDDAFVCAEPLGRLLGSFGESLVFVELTFGTVSTLLSEEVLSSSASVPSTYSLLSFDGFPVLFGGAFLAATTASLSFFKDDIFGKMLLGVCCRNFSHAIVRCPLPGPYYRVVPTASGRGVYKVLSYFNVQ